jgi:hypothetical protein
MRDVFGGQVERYTNLLAQFDQTFGTGDRTRDLERSINRTMDFTSGGSTYGQNQTQADTIADAVAKAVAAAMSNLKIEMDGKNVAIITNRYQYQNLTGITR